MTDQSLRRAGRTAHRARRDRRDRADAADVLLLRAARASALLDLLDELREVLPPEMRRGPAASSRSRDALLQERATSEATAMREKATRRGRRRCCRDADAPRRADRRRRRAVDAQRDPRAGQRRARRAGLATPPCTRPPPQSAAELRSEADELLRRHQRAGRGVRAQVRGRGRPLRRATLPRRGRALRDQADRGRRGLRRPHPRRPVRRAAARRRDRRAGPRRSGPAAGPSRMAPPSGPGRRRHHGPAERSSDGEPPSAAGGPGPTTAQSRRSASESVSHGLAVISRRFERRALG